MNVSALRQPLFASATSPAVRALAISATFVVLYILFAWLARFYMVRPFAITPWNPASGLALAFLLAYGVRYWPALAVAAIGTSLLLRGIPEPPFTQLLAPLFLTVGYAAMAVILLGPLKLRLAFDRPREIVKLCAVAALGTLLIAVAYVAAFRSIGTMSTQDYQQIVLRFWIGHLIGIVINTPLLLLLLPPRTWLRQPAPDFNRWETLAQIASVVLVLWTIFGPQWGDPYKLFYLLFLPVIWIATRHGIVGAILGIAFLQIGLIVAVVNSDFQSRTAVTEFQFMMLALAIGGLFLGMVVSESRAARNALDRSESRLRAVVSTAPDGIVTIDRNGIILAANPAAAQIFCVDCGVDALDGMRVQELLPGFQAIISGKDAGPSVGRRLDGAEFPVEVAIGSAGEGDDRLHIAVVRDVTRRVETARRLAEQQDELGRASRLAAAGEMAAALAHELHQPLTAIRNYARAAQMQPAAGAMLPGKIENEAARAAAVVQRLRDFFRGGTSHLECIAVGTLVDGALASMRELAAQNGVTLVTRIAAAETELMVDRIQIETVVHSLLHNAIEAMAGQSAPRRITVSTQAVGTDGLLRLAVTDTGPGIAAEMAHRVFEPFATSKATGTGMGLAMSRSMVEAHGGRIGFESTPGAGTVFYITLPTTALNEAET
jgi:two-component system sensor kinase FixL